MFQNNVYFIPKSYLVQIMKCCCCKAINIVLMQLDGFPFTYVGTYILIIKFIIFYSERSPLLEVMVISDHLCCSKLTKEHYSMILKFLCISVDYL